MAFVHNGSQPCLKTETDLFTLPPTQTAILSRKVISYKPIAPLSDNGPIEFTMPGQGDDYTDLAHCQLSLKVKIVKENGTDLSENDIVGPVNGFGWSIFEHMSVSWNNKTLNDPSHNHPYRCNIENLLTYGRGAQESHLTMNLWYKDEAGQHDSLKDNLGFTQRLSHCAKSKEVELLGTLHGDVFNQSKLLIPGVEMKLKFVRSRHSFCLMGDQDGKVVVTDATLLLHKVRLSPPVMLGHVKALEKATVKYPITRVDMKTATLSAGVQSKSIDNLYLGQMPKRVVIGLVDSAAYNGNRELNPFKYEHFDLNFLSLYVDGQQIPSIPLTPNFERAEYLACYETLFSGTNIHFRDEGNHIDRSEYPKGYTLFVFDLTPDLSGELDHWSPQQHGCMRMELRFRKPLPKVVTCLVYSEFHSLIEIDRYRNVTTDFTS